MSNAALGISSLEGKVGPEEWQARQDLAACYRLVALWEMTDMIANHISVRVPGTEDEFLINAYGLLYEEITASSLIRINLAGEILWKPDFDYGVNRAGFVIHSAVHRARHDAVRLPADDADGDAVREGRISRLSRRGRGCG
jgi:ribulose-5-phosphate 4-epimerase/fuculose-1-phosphate aldolase